MAPPHHLRTLTAALAAAVFGLALLAGCSDESDAETTDAPKEPPSATETTPAEPEEPARPAALDNGNEAGAKAVVRYYFALWDYAVDTGDVSGLKTLGGPNCVSCNDLAQLIARISRNGANVRGGLHTVRKLTMTRLQPRRKSDVSYVADSRVEATPQTIRNSGIKRLNGHYPGGISDYYFSMVYAQGNWQITSWQAP